MSESDDSPSRRTRMKRGVEDEKNNNEDDDDDDDGEGGDNSNDNNNDGEGGDDKDDEEEDNDTNNDDDGDDDDPTLLLESGPKFHVDERVLVTDAQQMSGTQLSEGELPHLYEAIIRQSGLKLVDPSTRKIMPERKKRGRRGRGGHHPHDHHDGPQHESSGGVKEWCHLIHFQGWNARHDKWMTESDVFQDTPKNRKRVGASVGKVARAPPKQQSKEDDKKKGKSKRGRKRKHDGDDDEGTFDDNIRGVYRKNLQLITKACTLPFTLQTILVDDRDKITTRIYPPPSFGSGNDNWAERRRRGIKMLHVLPSKTSIMDVLGLYIQKKKQEDVEEFAREQERQLQMKERNDDEEDTKTGGVGSSKEDGAAKDGDTNPTSPAESTTISPKKMLKLKRSKRKQFARSIITLVDISLPLFLLYREEQEQYVKYVAEFDDDNGNANNGGNKKSSSNNDNDNEEKDGDNDNADNTDGEEVDTIRRPSERYGAEHLLRFFVKLPFILSQHNPKKKNKSEAESDNDEDKDENEKQGGDQYLLASEEQSREFATYLSELIVFIQKNLEDCFKSKYFAVK